MKSSRYTTAALLAALLLFAGSAASQIYEYVDRNGNVTYTTERRGGPAPQRVLGSNRNTRETPEEIAGRPGSPNVNPNRASSTFDREIREAANAYDLPFELIKAVIRVESAFDPHAVSSAGARGLMQLMPATAEALNCSDAFDPAQNIMAGTQYLRILLDRYNGDLTLALSAYNAGPGAVQRARGIPFEETRQYSERVYQYYLEYTTPAPTDPGE